MLLRSWLGVFRVDGRMKNGMGRMGGSGEKEGEGGGCWEGGREGWWGEGIGRWLGVGRNGGDDGEIVSSSGGVQRLFICGPFL